MNLATGGMTSPKANRSRLAPRWACWKRGARSYRFHTAPGIANSRHSHMRELRVQYRGEPYRLLYAFDPRRVALLLIGGSKGGDDSWYDTLCADR